MSAYIDHLVKRERQTAVAEAARPEVDKIIAWNYQRAQVERQMGRNQIASGNSAGQLRIERADMHEATAELLRALTSP